jgi:predicted dehydrogenase
MAKRSYVILGLGSIGLRHARNLLALGRGVAGFDPDAGRRALLAEAGGEVLDEREAALARAANGAAVLIAGPSCTHRGDLLSVLPLDVPVFVEKPLATRLDGVAEALAAARSPVSVGHNQRLNPAVESASALLSQGRLGVPLWARAICASYMPAWRPSQDHRRGYAADPLSGGVIFDTIHELDLLHHLLGPFETVGAWARCSGTIGIASDDVADITLRHATNVQSTVHLDYLTRPSLRVTEIACTEGRIVIDVAARSIWAAEADGAIVLDQRAPGTIDDDYVRLMERFVACAEEGARPLCHGTEALAVLTETVRARRIAGLPQP